MAVTTTYQLKTFNDIITYVANELKVQTSSTEDMNRIRRAINVAYLNRVVQQTTSWPWIRKSTDLPFRARQTLTGAVTYNSPVVTLTTSPTESVEGYLFSALGLNQRLKIKSHTAGTNQVTLVSPWTGSTSAAATCYIWTDKIILPTDCREVISVTRNNWPVPLEMVNNSEFEQLDAVAPANAFDPTHYSVFEYIDPSPYQLQSGLPSVATASSSGVVRHITFNLVGPDVMTNYFQQGQRISVTGSSDYRFNIEGIISAVSPASITYTGRERFNRADIADTGIIVSVASIDSADARYQALSVFPNFLMNDKTITVRYAIEAAPLVNPTDEPRMQIGDRISLAFGALSEVWDSIGRNPEMAAKNEALFDRKLSQMVARISASNDYPTLVPDKQYLARKRRPRSLRDWYWD